MLMANVLVLAGKYVVHTMDSRSDVPWEEKSQIIFYIELVAGMCLALLLTL